MKSSRAGEKFDCFSSTEYESFLADMSDEDSDAIDLHADQCDRCRANRDEVINRLSEQPPLPGVTSIDTAPSLTDKVSTFGQDAKQIADPPLPSIDGLKIEEKLGRGGMGVVYLATELALNRKVAVKVVGPGMNNAEGIKRFREEKKLHASNGHPNIATFYRESQTEDGRACFIMEYLDGGPITDYCNTNKLKLSERLAMFVMVCDAVQHLHGMPIVHRDLAPQNILVGTSPLPIAKIIDFGIAKNTERVVSTSDPAYASSLLGHVSYMSPEQTGGRYKEINDSRTDVYSLGVLLFELLTGSPPLTSESAKSLSELEIIREICETVPPKVSQIVLNDDLAKSHSASMHLSPNRLSKELDHELDYIVSTALQKSPSNRYRNVAELTSDLRVYLNGGVINQSHPSRFRRWKKWCVANRAAALFLAALAIGVPALIGTMAYGMVQQKNSLQHQSRSLELAAENERIGQEKLYAETAARLKEQSLRIEADTMREKETQSRIMIEQQASSMKTLNSVLQTVFEGFNPHLETAGDGELREALVSRMTNVAHEIVEKKLAGDDDGVRMKQHLAETLNIFGEVGPSIELWKSIVDDQDLRKGRVHRDTLVGLINLGRTELRADPKDALATLLEAKLVSDELYPKGAGEHNEVDHFLSAAYEKTGDLDNAYQIREELMRRMEKLDVAPMEIYIDSLNNQGTLATKLKKYDEAEAVFSKAIEFGTEHLSAAHPVVLTFRQNLVMAKNFLGKKKEVVKESRLILKLLKSQLPESSPPVVNARHQLAVYLATKESHDESLSLFQQIVDGDGPLPSRYHANLEIQTINFLFSDDSLAKQSAVEKLEKLQESIKLDLGAEHPVSKLAQKRAKDYRVKLEEK